MSIGSCYATAAGCGYLGFRLASCLSVFLRQFPKYFTPSGRTGHGVELETRVCFTWLLERLERKRDYHHRIVPKTSHLLRAAALAKTRSVYRVISDFKALRVTIPRIYLFCFLSSLPSLLLSSSTRRRLSPQRCSGL